MPDVVMTVVGNVVAEPRCSETRSGVPFTAFRVASTSRRFDQQAGAMVKGESVFLDVRCWRGAARSVAAALTKGSPVIVHGRLRTRSYTIESPEGGAKRSVTELDAIALGLDLSRLPAAAGESAGALPETDGAPPGVAA